MKVINRHTGKELSHTEILVEVNRDHSDEWQDYDEADLNWMPDEVLEWLDPQYYEVTL
jgi:hypothetical protein